MFLKFQKQVHTSQHIVEARGKTFQRWNSQPWLHLSFIEKFQTTPTSQSLGGRNSHYFHNRTIYEILTRMVERNTLVSSLGISRDCCFVLWSSLRRTLPHTVKYFEKV